MVTRTKGGAVAPIDKQQIVKVSPELASAQRQFSIASLPAVIETQEQFEQITAQQAAARTFVANARAYFAVLLKPAKETVAKIQGACTEFVDPVLAFESACRPRVMQYTERERLRRVREQEIARQRELEALRQLAADAVEESPLSDAITDMIEDVKSAPVERVTVASSTMTTVTRKVLEIVDVSAFCRWIANADPAIAAEFSEELIAAARRFHKDTKIVPDGCEIKDSETQRRKS